jgi:hypothetical protein
LSGWFKIYKYEKVITSAFGQGRVGKGQGVGPRRRNRYILSSDFGIGENMSLGLTANYLLLKMHWEIFLILDNE